MAKGLDEGNHLEAIGARVRNDLCYVRLAVCVVRGDIPDVSSEGKHVLVLYEDSRRSRRGEEGKEVLEVSQLWRGAFQVQMDDATSRYVSGSTGIEEAYRKTRFKFSLHVRTKTKFCFERSQSIPCPVRTRIWQIGVRDRIDLGHVDFAATFCGIDSLVARNEVDLKPQHNKKKSSMLCPTGE